MELSGDALLKMAIAAIGFVAWLVRLEAKVKTNSDSIQKQEVRLNVLESLVLVEIRALGEKLAKIQGRLGVE